MAYILAPEIPEPGFSYENCLRNAKLYEAGAIIPKAATTGTTVVGIIFADGVILGSDTRSTYCCSVVENKNARKIRPLADNIYCCGSGIRADVQKSAQLVASQIALLSLNTGREVPVVTATTLLKHMLYPHKGKIVSNFVVGGVDKMGSHLYWITAWGSSFKNMYSTIGSGYMASMAVCETQWKPNMTEEEGKILVRNAVTAGIYNDLNSGNSIDLCVIRKGRVDFLPSFIQVGVKGQRHGSHPSKGATAVLSTTVTHYSDAIIGGGDAMFT